MYKKKYYYHITALENVEKIKEKGLIAGPDKHIYLFTNLNIKNWAFNFDGYLPDIIAARQVFLEKYCLLTIDATGISKKINEDNVAEHTARFQRRIKQVRINPEFIIKYEERELEIERLNDWSSLWIVSLFNGLLYTKKEALKLYETGELPLDMGNLKKHFEVLMPSNNVSN